MCKSLGAVLITSGLNKLKISNNVINHQNLHSNTIMDVYKQKFYLYFLIFLCIFNATKCSDITNLVFGSLTDGMPAAFGDFNSDELTDVFVLRDNGKTVEIFLAAEEEPLLRLARPNPLRCAFDNLLITSVVPGDFDGDALMDILVTTIHKNGEEASKDRRSLTSVHIHWGGANYLNCSNEQNPIIKMIGQPLAIDYNQDMIIDLFGQDEDGNRAFWVFNNSRSIPEKVLMEDNRNHDRLSVPHAHAYLGTYNNVFLSVITNRYQFCYFMHTELLSKC